MKKITEEYPKTAGRVQIDGAYRSSDGLVEGIGEEGVNFVKGYEESVTTTNNERAKWVEKLRSVGVSMARPDDGYNHREEGYLSAIAYPYFNDGVKVGSMIAFGDYDKFVIVIVYKTGGLFSKSYYYKSTIW